MSGKYIEVSVASVDRDQDPAMSATIGMIQFRQDDVEAPAIVLNPIDFKTLALLKRFVDKQWAEQESLRKSVEG
jgi:hypothetical protein